MDSSAALLALVMNLYMEARGESPEGMRAVADTVHTRVMDKRYPDNHFDVIMAPKQFSWTSQYKIETIGDLIALQHRVLHSKKMNSRDMEAYKRAVKIANQVLSDGYRPRYHFTHFHTTAIRPMWTYSGKRKVVIGRHVFMRL